MNDQRILDDILALLEAYGVTVRPEPLGGSAGGLCCVKGKNIFFLDTQSTAAQNAVLCAEAVAKILDIENIYLRPEIRGFIEAHSPIKTENENGT